MESAVSDDVDGRKAEAFGGVGDIDKAPLHSFEMTGIVDDTELHPFEPAGVVDVAILEAFDAVGVINGAHLDAADLFGKIDDAGCLEAVYRVEDFVADSCQLYARYGTARDIDDAGGLKARDIFFVDVEDAGELHTGEAGFIATDEVDGNFIGDLRIERAIGAQAGDEGKLDGAPDEDFFEVQRLHPQMIGEQDAGEARGFDTGDEVSAHGVERADVVFDADGIPGPLRMGGKQERLRGEGVGGDADRQIGAGAGPELNKGIDIGLFAYHNSDGPAFVLYAEGETAVLFAQGGGELRGIINAYIGEAPSCALIHDDAGDRMAPVRVVRERYRCPIRGGQEDEVAAVFEILQATVEEYIEELTDGSGLDGQGD